MQRIHQPIPGAQLGTSISTVYTASAGVTATINNLSVTNTSATAGVTVNLYRVPPSGTAGASNIFLDTFSLASKQTYVPPQAIGLALAPGWTLQASASATTSITLNGGVYETSGS